MASPIFLLIAFSCLAAGILLTLIIRKLVFEKDHIQTSIYQDLNDRFQGIVTEKALADERGRMQLEELETIKNKYLKFEELSNQLKEDIAALKASYSSILGEKANLILEKDETQLKLDQKASDLMSAAGQIVELKIKLADKTELYNQQKSDLEQMTEKLKKDFSLLANEILDEKTQKFNETQQKELSTLLDPLKTNLSEFKDQVEKTYKTENDERISLREQVKHMMTLNEVLSKEAKALTMALTGGTKKQGDWGELILESILEYCGLQKGIHYFTQETAQNEEGEKIRPDVLVKYPDSRAVIIDSKVSLQHYEQLCREENPDTQVILLNRMLQSFYSHIDNLSSKNYSAITDSLDMVIMFLPVEAAYITALQNDPALQKYAFKKNILLTSASNLTLAIKLIHDMWKRDAVNKNAEAIADRAGKLYDKLVGFVENFEKIGKAIGSLHNIYGEAHKQLANGKGNIVIQAEQMKQLEIKASKQMPVKYVSEASSQELLTIADNFGG